MSASADLELNADELRVFYSFYQRRLSEAGQPRDDSEELEIARDILAAVVNDGLTPTADGGASYVRRGAVDWTDPATLQAAQTAAGASNSGRPPAQKSNRGWLQGLAVLGLALLALGWFFWPAGGDKKKAAHTTAEATLVAPDVAGDGQVTAPSPTPVPTLETELLADIVGAGAKTKQLVVPRTLELKGVSFIVQPVKVGVGDWPLPAAERAVSWVHGTVINYVLGLEGTPANKQLLASLQPGNQMLLRMSTGVVYRFVYADTVRVAPQAAEVFWQNRPGLTLALLGDRAETRVVIRALYVPEFDLESGDPAPVEQAAPGQPVALDDRLRLTYLGRVIVPAPESLPGYAYLGVNYAVEYVTGGNAPLLTAGFMHHLEADGLTYPAVSATGALPYPALPERLLPRQPFTTTVVYAVPLNVLRQELTWEFVADPGGGGEKARAVIPPYDGLLASMVAMNKVDTDNGRLVVVLDITAALTNLTLQPTDLQVQGGAISPSGNYFPWRLRAGEQREFVLVLTPDGSGKVTISLLEQGIEVTYGK